MFPETRIEPLVITSLLLELEASALVRGMLFLLVWVGLWLPIAIVLAIYLNWRPLQPLSVGQKLPLLLSLYLLAPAVVWQFAWWFGESAADLGLPWRWSLLASLGLGLLLGLTSLIAKVAIEWRLGWLRWQIPAVSLPRLAATLLLGLWVGFTEELVFRGLLQNQVQQQYSAWGAALLVSLVFALLHLVWEGQENLPQIPGLWLMGMVLTLARWVDQGNLGLAWGLHSGWIWAIALLDSTSALTYTGKASPWWTGWGGKPLAGAVGILFLLGVAAVLWVLLLRGGAAVGLAG